ncbi:MAG: hypothetical protein L6V88_03580 [Anaerotruncus sp.]|nr:MAG: hypothetical protein L6V88_03580 [Anaerotruncus sp.]
MTLSVCLIFARLPLYSSVGGMRIISGETAVGLCELAQKSTSSDAGTLLAVRALSVFAACGSLLNVKCDKIIKFTICAACLLTGNICPALVFLAFFVSPAGYFFLLLLLGAQAIVCSFMSFFGGLCFCAVRLRDFLCLLQTKRF